MNTKRNWNKVAVVVVLALASLSSMAFSAPSPAIFATILAADVCVEESVGHFDQYLAAIEWAEQDGTDVPFALTVSCVEDNLDLNAWFAGYGGESWVRFEQYMAAIESVEQSLTVEPARVGGGSAARFDQYSAAIDWAEQGGQVPEALSVDRGGDNLDLIASFAGYGGESWVRFEQYMAAIKSTELTELSGALAVLRSVRVPTFAPEPPTGENKLPYFGRAIERVEQSATSRAPLIDQSNPVALELRGWEWAAAPVPNNEINTVALELRGWEWAAAPVPQNESKQDALEKYFAALALREWEWAAAPVSENEIGLDPYEQYVAATAPGFDVGQREWSRLKQYLAGTTGSFGGIAVVEDYLPETDTTEY